MGPLAPIMPDGNQSIVVTGSPASNQGQFFTVTTPPVQTNLPELLQTGKTFTVKAGANPNTAKTGFNFSDRFKDLKIPQTCADAPTSTESQLTAKKAIKDMSLPELAKEERKFEEAIPRIRKEIQESKYSRLSEIAENLFNSFGCGDMDRFKIIRNTVDNLYDRNKELLNYENQQELYPYIHEIFGTLNKYGLNNCDCFLTYTDGKITPNNIKDLPKILTDICEKIKNASIQGEISFRTEFDIWEAGIKVFK